jgi:hypothetical protein
VAAGFAEGAVVGDSAEVAEVSKLHDWPDFHFIGYSDD